MLRNDGTDLFERLDNDRRSGFDLDANTRGSGYIDQDPNLVGSPMDKSAETPIEKEGQKVTEDPTYSGGKQGELVEESPKEPNEEYDVKIHGNPVYVIAKHWKESGRLPEDFEVTESITDEEFDHAFFSYKEKTAADIVKSEAVDEFIKAEGLTPDIINRARLLSFGNTDEDLQQLNLYENLAAVELTEADDSYDDDFKNFGLAYYIDKGFTQEQAQRYVNRDIDEPERDLIVNEYKAYFKDKRTKLAQTINNRVEQERTTRVTQERDRIDFIKKSLASGQVDGRKLQKSQIDFVNRAIFEKTELVKDSNGNARMVTLEQKKILESQNDPAKKLRARIDFILGNDTSHEDESFIKAKNSLTKDLKELVKIAPKMGTPKVASAGSSKYEFEQELS